MAITCDVAIIGGGPAGSTVGSFLKKYNPSLEVVILEREVFPRDHVGESLLPRLSRILFDLGVWDKVEAAGFAIKIGAKYRWGTTDNLWDFNFTPGGEFKGGPRPAKYEGERPSTAFQVDRSIYDKILLDHSKELGVRVFENVRVTSVERDGDRITELKTQDVGKDTGHRTQDTAVAEGFVTARYYVDASGSSGLLRRALDIGVQSPTSLRNVAIWDYWQNAEWAEHIGVGGTRIQVLSLGWGWIWFIPLTPTRTSIGLVLPADTVKQSDKKPEELYLEALAQEKHVVHLTRNATREKILQSTKDWNYIAERLAGENWFLAGDAAGFADPILSAGMTLAMSGAARVANVILELDRGELDAAWLKEDYSRSQKAQIRNHMAFADFWYSANAQFTELKEYCSEIARKSGLELDADSAFQWLGTGGFAHDDLGAASNAHCRISAIKYNVDQLAGRSVKWAIEQSNDFHLDMEGAEEVSIASHGAGKVTRLKGFKRGSNLLPLAAAYGAMHDALNREHEFEAAMERFVFEFKKTGLVPGYDACFWIGCETLEAMIAEGWVKGSYNPETPLLKIVATPKKFLYGWWREGVGMLATNPTAYGTVILTPQQLEDLVPA